MSKSIYRAAIVGGGAAGFFGAINLAEGARSRGIPLEVSLFESSSQYLKKVRISGGGRCNVTHNLFEPSSFCQNYPRGQRELLSPMNQFQALDTVGWFKQRGVELVPEEDGRMFPVSNSSQTVIDCFIESAEQAGVQLNPKRPVKRIDLKEGEGWSLVFNDETTYIADTVLIATGSSPRGYELATSLGHRITERAPSLFSFKIEDDLLEGLPGLSFSNAEVTLKMEGSKGFKQKGPMLITHWGLSGPAILKLSAWAAREMKRVDYKALLRVNWLGELSRADLENKLKKIKSENGKSFVKNVYLEQVPKRFWINLLASLEIDGDKQWANLTGKEFNKIIEKLSATELVVAGQNRFKEEFVECGGVSLKEINFKTMESRIAQGIYFAGELLDVDGVTGGFNFQNAWTTAWISAQDIVNKADNFHRMTSKDD